MLILSGLEVRRRAGDVPVAEAVAGLELAAERPPREAVRQDAAAAVAVGRQLRLHREGLVPRLLVPRLRRGAAMSTEDCYAWFEERARANLHIVLCFAPSGDKFYERKDMTQSSPQLTLSRDLRSRLCFPQPLLRTALFAAPPPYDGASRRSSHTTRPDIFVTSATSNPTAPP